MKVEIGAMEQASSSRLALWTAVNGSFASYQAPYPTRWADPPVPNSLFPARRRSCTMSKLAAKGTYYVFEELLWY